MHHTMVVMMHESRPGYIVASAAFNHEEDNREFRRGVMMHQNSRGELLSGGCIGASRRPMSYFSETGRYTVKLCCSVQTLHCKIIKEKCFFSVRKVKQRMSCLRTFYISLLRHDLNNQGRTRRQVEVIEMMSFLKPYIGVSPNA